MSVKKTRDEIRQRLIGAQAKRVFLVEGTDDEAAFRILLGRFVPDWEQRWAIHAAGNKGDLQKLLKLEHDWVGLVDRDEWDQAVVDQRQAELPNLMVLPRFCLENYLINPAELWFAIPAARQAGITGGEGDFHAEIVSGLARFLRHGVLWRVVAPLWSGLRALGFKEALASETSLLTAQNDAEIQQVLQAWDTLLDPQRIFADFKQQLAAASVATLDVQLAQWVHGKIFWKQAVNPVMNRLLGQMQEDERRKKILRKLALPADLQPIFDRLA